MPAMSCRFERLGLGRADTEDFADTNPLHDGDAGVHIRVTCLVVVI